MRVLLSNSDEALAIMRALGVDTSRATAVSIRFRSNDVVRVAVLATVHVQGSEQRQWRRFALVPVEDIPKGGQT